MSKLKDGLHAMEDDIISRHTCCATLEEEELKLGCKEYMSKDNQKLIAIRPKRSVVPHKSLKIKLSTNKMNYDAGRISIWGATDLM